MKPRLLGHWGTTHGLNFIYAHINRIIKPRDRRPRPVRPNRSGFVLRAWRPGSWPLE
ncbi:MAG TPA: hypothetical protein VK326_07310 [Solirubrobacterales bacterium]|nr:hypothetical protein [Solirubrobacterales bacterium]